MKHAGSVETMRTTRTLDALVGAVDAGLLSSEDKDALSAAWWMASQLRNGVTQVRGRSYDSLPRDARERAAVAYICGYQPGESDALVNDYLRVTRRARQVVDRVFWE
jgi:glutamate-ammonia-ligase adenylyltransferase